MSVLQEPLAVTQMPSVLTQEKAAFAPVRLVSREMESPAQVLKHNSHGVIFIIDTSVASLLKNIRASRAKIE